MCIFSSLLFYSMIIIIKQPAEAPTYTNIMVRKNKFVLSDRSFNFNIPALLLTMNVPLEKILNLYEPSFPHLQNENDAG